MRPHRLAAVGWLVAGTCFVLPRPAAGQTPAETDLEDASALDGGAASLDASVAETTTPETPASPTHLSLAVVGNPPFLVETGDGELGGLSVQVWREIADDMDVEYELTAVPNATEAVGGVAEGRFDGAIGPISITSDRARVVSFSQPYWQATLAILARPGGGMWERVKPFLSRAFFGGIAILLVILTLVGALLWAVERKPNDQFPKTPLHGIGVGIWLALVTMTTVGYGDKAPITPLGRAITGIWMVLATLTASSLTAGIATTLTVSQLDHSTIDSAEGLRDQRVAAVGGTIAASFVEENGGRLVPAENVADAVARLERGEVEAVVHDRPVLLYYLRQNPDVEAVLSTEDYEPQGYGFAFPIDSALLHDVNVALLDVEERGRLEEMRARWL